ncbi:MAG: diguanylate cyclase [Candidatus Nanopelagicales bacterium]
MSGNGAPDSPSGRVPALRNLPFAVAGVAGVLVALTGVERTGFAWLAAGLTLASALAAVLLPWHRLPGWAPTLLSLAVVLTVGLLLVAVGSEPAGAVAIVLLPVFWLALFGTAAQLALVVAAVPVALMMPALVPEPEVSWGSAVASTIVVTLVAGSLGAATHQLVGEVRRRRAAESRAHRRLRRVLDTSRDTAVVMWSSDGVVTGLNRAAQDILGVSEAEAVGRLGPDDILGPAAMRALTAAVGFGNPADPDAMGDGLLSADRWDTDDRAVGGVTARVGTGTREVWARLDLGAVTDDLGHAAEFVLVVHDITDLEVAQRELEAAREDLATVVQVLHRAQEGADVRTTVCREARRVAGADVAAIFEPRDGVLVVTTEDGLSLGDLAVPLEPVDSAVARAFTTGRRLQIVDALRDPRASAGLAQQEGLRGLLYEPIRHEGQVVAVLGVGWRAPGTAVPARVADSVWALASEAGLAMHRERAVRRLESRARLDALTGVPNRREWDRLVSDWVRPPAEGAPDDAPGSPLLCLAMLDLDHFKAWNDERGHQAGDALLRDAASAWRRQLRGDDVLARYGGEEFGVLLPGCGLGEARGVLERLRRATPAPATVSVGLAEWDGHEPPESLVARADAALYAAKAAGRDRVEVAPAAADQAPPR